MKKYFIIDGNEPLEFGDTLELELEKEQDGKKIKRKVEVKFTPDTLPLLLEENAIEEREVEEQSETIDFSADDDPVDSPEGDFDNSDGACPLPTAFMAAVIDVLNDFHKEMDKQNDVIKKLKKKVETLEGKKQKKEDKEDKEKDEDFFLTIEDYIKRNKDIFKPVHNWTFKPDGVGIEMFDITL